MISAVAGFITGSFHVFAGPDHLSAISPLAIENNKSASSLGLRWGLGHTTGVFLLGFVALIMMTLLLVTSSNYAVNFLGNKAWKFLHMSAHTVFYLVSFHIIYHVFMEGPWQENLFSFIFIGLAVFVIVMQILAFVKVVKMDKKKVV